MRISILFLTLLCCITSFSQTFTGTVTGKGGMLLDGASIVLTVDNNKTVAFCITNEKGRYEIKVPEGTLPDNVHISFMGYERKTLPFTDFKNGMTITLKESGFRLKEVRVKAQRIKQRGDTLTYSVAGFRQGQDRSIADVISKMPGLEVKADGKIEYQGKSISKFYIEGLDLMGSQYGLASNNISADKVKSVQVLENHQAVKSLRGVSFSDQAALNIVLKDNAKSTWAGAADIVSGYGDETLYDCRLTGMNFRKNFQTLLLYKNNNTGEQIYRELMDLTARYGRINTEEGILSLMKTASPDIAEERYTFNRSHLFAGNWLWKVGKETELRIQGNGYIDKTEMQSYRSTTYFTIADLPLITEEQDITNTKSEWKVEADYQYNGEKTFIKNNVRAYLDMKKSVGSTLLNTERTSLLVKPQKRYLTNDFQMSHTTSEGNVYNIRSFFTYNYLPGQLLTVNGITERLNLGFFSTQNNIRYKLKIGKHYLNNMLGVNYDYQNICVSFDDEEEKKNAYRFLQAYWTPSVSFQLGKHKVDIASKISHANQEYKESGSNHFWIDPSLHWNWQPSVVSSFFASVSYTNSPVKGKSIYDTPIFTGYRTMKVNSGKTETVHSTSASFAYRYANPVAGIFFNLLPLYSRVSGNVLYQSTLQENIYMQTATDKKYATELIGVSGRVSKAFSWAKSTVSLNASHNISNYSMLVTEEVHEGRMKATSLALDYSLSPFRLLSIEGKSTIEIYKQQNLTKRELSSGNTSNWRHNMDIHFFPAEKWMVSVKNNLFHSNEEGTDPNYFLDISISYKSRSWELSLMANNIIGTSEFERRMLGNTIEMYSVTRLRPREFLAKWCFDL